MLRMILHHPFISVQGLRVIFDEEINVPCLTIGFNQEMTFGVLPDKLLHLFNRFGPFLFHFEEKGDAKLCLFCPFTLWIEAEQFLDSLVRLISPSRLLV